MTICVGITICDWRKDGSAVAVLAVVEKVAVQLPREALVHGREDCPFNGMRQGALFDQAGVFQQVNLHFDGIRHGNSSDVSGNKLHGAVSLFVALSA